MNIWAFQEEAAMVRSLILALAELASIGSLLVMIALLAKA